MGKTRIGIIGLGMASTPHAKSLVDLADRVEVAAAYSPTETRRREFSQRWNLPVTDRLEEMFADPSVDAVLVLTPPSTHLELVQRAASAGKHILLEKPLEITTERAARLVEAAERAGVKLGIVLQHRFRPAGRQLREMVQAGELGRVLGASAEIRNWRPQSYYDQPGRGTKARDGGGVLLTQAIHTLDLMLSIAGPIAEVASYVTTTPVHRMETEDFCAAAVVFENGALGTIEATTSAFPGFPERIDIVGEAGSASVFGTELKVVWKDGRTAEFGSHATRGGAGADPMDFPHDYHRDLIADFLDAIAAGCEPTVNGAEALKVHRLIDALLESGATGRRVRVSGG